MPKKEISWVLKARDSATAVLRKVGGRFKKLASVGINVAGKLGKAFGLIGAGGTAAFAALVKSQKDYIANLRRQMSVTGLAVKEQQRLNYVADQFQVDQDAMGDAVKEASMRMTEMAGGGVQIAKEALALLNMEAGELATMLDKDVTGALTKIGKRMQGLSRGERSLVMDQLFGGQAAERVREILVDNADAIERIGKEVDGLRGLSTEGLKNAKEFNQAWVRVKRTLVGIRNNVMPRIMEGLTSFLERFGKTPAFDNFIKRLERGANLIRDTLKVLSSGKEGSAGKIWSAGSDLILTALTTGGNIIANKLVNVAPSIGKLIGKGVKDLLPGSGEDLKFRQKAMEDLGVINAYAAARQESGKPLQKFMTSTPAEAGQIPEWVSDEGRQRILEKAAELKEKAIREKFGIDIPINPDMSAFKEKLKVLRELIEKLNSDIEKEGKDTDKQGDKITKRAREIAKKNKAVFDSLGLGKTTDEGEGEGKQTPFDKQLDQLRFRNKLQQKLNKGKQVEAGIMKLERKLGRELTDKEEQRYRKVLKRKQALKEEGEEISKNESEMQRMETRERGTRLRNVGGYYRGMQDREQKNLDRRRNKILQDMSNRLRSMENNDQGLALR